MALEPVGDVVGAEDGHLGSVLQSLRPHQRDVGPGDRQDRSAAKGSAGYRIDHMVGTLRRLQRVVRQEGRQVLAHADRAHARAAAAVGNAEGLVQIEMGHIGPEFARRGDAYQRIEVGAVDVHLAAVAMDDLAELDNALLEHAVGGRVGHHDGRQLVAVALGLGLQVRQVHVAVFVAFDNHDLQAGHSRTGRIGAVGGARDQTDVAMMVTAALMVALDGKQAGVFALGTCVGLHPRVCSVGAKGCMRLNSGQLIATISVVALSFMVQEPSGIMARFRAMSLSSKRRM